MRVPLSWIREFAPVEGSAADVADALNEIGLIVDAVELPGREIGGVVAARVLGVVDHPNADKLTLVDVDTGERQTRVVCGARNLAPGDVVPYAPAGARLPGGLTLERRKIRGEVSDGMLCSARELGLGDDHDTTLHYEPHALQLGDVAQRIAADRYEVGEKPRRHDAEVSLLPQQLGGHRCRRLDSLHWRHAVLHVVLELPRLMDLGPREPADVRAHGDLDAFAQGAGKGASLERDAGRPDPPPRPRHVNADGHGRHPVHSTRHRDVHQRVGEPVAVLDGMDAGAQRRGDAVGPDGVGRDAPAQPLGLVHDGARFVVFPELVVSGGALVGVAFFHARARRGLATVNLTTGDPGPRVMPINEDHDRARDSLSKLEGLEAAVVAPGHGEPFEGSPADAVARARAA